MKFNIYRREVRVNQNETPTLSVSAVSDGALPAGYRGALAHALTVMDKSFRSHPRGLEAWLFGDRDSIVIECSDSKISADIPVRVAAECVDALFEQLAQQITCRLPFYESTAKGFAATEKMIGELEKRVEGHEASIDAHGGNAVDKLYRDLLERVEAGEKAFAELQKQVEIDRINNRNRFQHYTRHLAEHHEGNRLSALIRNWRNSRKPKKLRGDPNAGGVVEPEGQTCN